MNAKGDIVGGSQVNVANTASRVGGVDDRLAVSAVIDFDTGLDCRHVGGIQCQGDIVEVLLEELNRPSHQLRAVALGRPDVDVQISGAGGNLLTPADAGSRIGYIDLAAANDAIVIALCSADGIAKDNEERMMHCHNMLERGLHLGMESWTAHCMSSGPLLSAGPMLTSR